MRAGRTIKGAAITLGLALLGPPAAPASFPGPNGPILFEASAPGAGHTDVWALNPAAGAPVNLTDLPGGPGEGRDPTASGDGSLIAFATGPPGDSEIWTMAADGSRFDRLTEPNGAIDDQPALSRDGAFIAFRTDRAGDEDIWIMRSDGTAAAPLLTRPGADAEPQFHPEGSVLTASSFLGSDFDIVALPAQGGPYSEVADPPVDDPRASPQSVTYYSPGDDHSPSIRPDGSRVAYAAGHGADADILDVFFNGTDFLPIAPRPGVAESQPSFSPDGTKLVYISASGLTVAASGGANAKPLATDPAQGPADPEWAVGERRDTEAPETEIVKRPRNRGAKRKVTYRFRASEPAAFECKRDRRTWRACKSPLRWKRLTPGRHRFRVRAIDLAGNTDPSPAVDRFRILRRRR